MKIILPKDLRGITFSKITTINLVEFDIDLLLPALFFRLLSGGRNRGRKTNDPSEISKYVDMLAKHPHLSGFDTDDGRRILNRLVRTSLIVTGKIGRAHRGEQILSIVPYSLLSCKPGFLKQGDRQRGVDTFIYSALHQKLQADDALREYIKQVFGKGVRIESPHSLDGKYDGVTDLDTITRLSLAFLDGFEASGIGREKDRVTPGPCPALVNELAEDILRFLFAYYQSLPNQALVKNLLGLINIELFVYTLKLVCAVNELVENPHIRPSAMQDVYIPSGPEIYIDFTGIYGVSRQMAQSCVRRDIEHYQQFLYSNLFLRTLDSYVDSLRRNKKRHSNIEIVLPNNLRSVEYLQKMLLLLEDLETDIALQASARNDENRIRSETVPLESGIDAIEDEEDQLWIDSIANLGESDLERVVSLLVEAQRAQAMTGYVSWFAGSGGLNKSHGMLSGSARRQTWRYEPSNDLLTVLVQLAAARLAPKKQHNDESLILPEIPLAQFLSFLENRFGILVDRPPAQFSGAEHMAAARDNLRAMLSRLRQMGMFTDLSDDFTVQRLRLPYAPSASIPEARI